MYGLSASSCRCCNNNRNYGYSVWRSRQIVSHLVTPRGFRAGKTQNWLNNTLQTNKISGGNLTTVYGLEKLCRRLMKKKRLYLVNTAVAGIANKKNEYRILFAPKIKIRPNTRVTGTLGRKLVFRPIDMEIRSTGLWRAWNFKKQKIAKLKFHKRPKRLNKWLSRRMFRGAVRSVSVMHSNVPKHAALDRELPRYIKNNAPAEKKLTHGLKKSVWKSIKFLYYDKLRKRHRWKFTKISLRRFNSRKFSSKISRILNKPLKIKCMNIFSYLFKKQLLEYKSHQTHFWNFRYRRYRFQFKNYYDIVNSFLFMGLLNNAEMFFLSILKIVLPLILKFRKFFRFLSLAINYLPEIKERFLLFRLFIAGKLAGGTKRTKFNKLGYGVLAVQSLTEGATSNFMSFTHIYGEFGVGLLMVKNVEYAPKLNF